MEANAATLVLERAEDRDAEALLALKQRAFAEEIAMNVVAPPGFDDLEKQRRAIRESIYYKVLLGGRLVGGICLVDQGDAGYYLGAIYVDAGEQGAGIGSRAMEALLVAHPEQRRWRLETPCRSYRNHHFYEKHGFVRVGEFTPEYSRTPEFRLVRFEKPAER